MNRLARVLIGRFSFVAITLTCPYLSATPWFVAEDSRARVVVFGYTHEDAGRPVLADGKKAPVIPRFLYHWVSPETLLQLVEKGYNGGAWPKLQPLATMTTLLTTHYPSIRTAPQGGLFTWINPETTTRGADYERYGEVLVRFEIDVERAKVLLLQSGRRGEKAVDALFSGTIPVAQANLVVHLSKMREWVIVDRSIIKSFTADPEILRADLETRIKKLHDPLYWGDNPHFEPLLEPLNSKSSRFSGTASNKNYALYRLERFLSEGKRIVPREFLDGSVSDRATLRKEVVAFRRQEVRDEISDEIRFGAVKGPDVMNGIVLYSMRSHLEAIDAGLTPAKGWAAVRVVHDPRMKSYDFRKLFSADFHQHLSTSPQLAAFDAKVRDLSTPFAEVQAAFEVAYGGEPGLAGKIEAEFNWLKRIRSVERCKAGL